MKQIVLNGEWQLRGGTLTDSLAARVPGCVHMDLLNAGKLDDPFYRDNESKQFWIGESDWTYERSFDLPAEFLTYPRVLLRSFGLDTLATVAVNGIVVGKADNMYRTWTFDAKPHLKAGENTITVRFDAPMPFLRQQEAEKGKLPAWVGNERLNGGAWLRKEPCNFGWDWGPKLVTSGIWRDIELIAFAARLSDVAIEQHHSSGQVSLNVQVKTDGETSDALTARVQVSFNGEVVASTVQPIVDHQTRAALTINQPQLWWINGMGEQPLYEVSVRLVKASGAVLDEQTRRIGLRTLTLERHNDQWGESFYFAINGLPFFAKGANWIPADTFAPRLQIETYQQLIHDAAAANMNMLRVWGGGIYEQDVFYDLCDQYGIALWQDFMFACGTYPAYDADFMSNVRAEAEDNIRRLRHHPSLALWCGNNELEQGLVDDTWTDRAMSWEDYDKLFDVLLREAVERLDPQRSYWPCSPHTSVGDRVNWMSAESGDTHLWSVWHGREPFEWYRTCYHRFVSEFGFQSFPEPATLKDYIEPADRNFTSYVMEYRQRSGIGNSTIIHYLLNWFRLPTSFENSIWLSQILQSLAIKYALEHWRRNMPRTMGALYWQLNDCWPGPSWSSIDSLGRWKALHYAAKRFYAPLLISGLEDADKGTIEVHVTSDLADEKQGQVRWSLTNVAGDTLGNGELEATIPPYQNTRLTTLDFSEAIAKLGVREVLVWLELWVDGKLVSENMVLFARPKHLNLLPPDIQYDVREVGDRRFEVTLTCRKLALWVWLSSADGEYQYSDNFFHLLPGTEKVIEVTTQQPQTANELRERLHLQSLVNTYEEAVLQQGKAAG